MRLGEIVALTKADFEKEGGTDVMTVRDAKTQAGIRKVPIHPSLKAFGLCDYVRGLREGIAKAKAEGKYKGRKPTARAKAQEVLTLKEQGVGATEIAKRLEIGRASVYRILKDAA